MCVVVVVVVLFVENNVLFLSGIILSQCTSLWECSWCSGCLVLNRLVSLLRQRGRSPLSKRWTFRSVSRTSSCPTCRRLAASPVNSNSSRSRHSSSHRLLSGHVSFMQICSSRIFHRLPHLSHISANAHIAYFFPHKLPFSTAILTLFVFLLPISIRFLYLDHLVAKRMAPSMCPDPCGTSWGSWFQAILYHISAYFRRTFGFRSYGPHIFFKCCTNNWHAHLSLLQSSCIVMSSFWW